MAESPGIVTFLFTDIEGSSQLWEKTPERMRPALARHDVLSRAAVENNRGVIVKTTGDGVHAYFVDPLDAVHATVALQTALAEARAADGVPLNVRCGLHAGVDERRDGDFFGPEVNRAARLMSVAHGGQVLVSQAVASLVRDRLPAGLTLRDLGSVRLRDLSIPERVYQLTHPRLRDTFPALRTVDATPNNIVRPLTSFVGRQRELAAVRELLGKSRLLTLCGAGGIGKTRLSIELAIAVLADHPDGVWFVELAPLADARLVPQVVASVLGVKEEPDRPVVEALVRYLEKRRVLLVLDNCEHLVRACAELARTLLQSTAQLAIVASSREPLHVGGEITYQVPPLAVPARDAVMEPGELATFESIRLFDERARALRSDFAVTRENAAAVMEVCRRLDGLPLALELAAARVRSMTVETIAERLNDRFRLLTRGDRTALPRQQTLRALIDWSYDLLDEAERALLRRLSVFAGGWKLAAAEAVCGDDGTCDDVVDVLDALVQKSLVDLDPAGNRYRLLESVREYAVERLRESGEEGAVRDRHLRFFWALAEEAYTKFGGPAQSEWLEHIDVERENVLTALAWTPRAADGARIGLELVHSLKLYWFNRGLVNLAYRLIVEELALAGADERTNERSIGLFMAGQICSYMGRYAEAEAFLQESLSIAREIGSKLRIGAVLQPLGLAALGRGDLEAAGIHLEEAVTLAREQENVRELAAAVTLLATLRRMTGNLAGADALYREALALARDLGDQESIAIGLLNLSICAIARADPQGARPLLLEALEVAAQEGWRRVGQSVIDIAAGLAVAMEHDRRAARFYGVAEALATDTGLRRDAADEAFLAPLVAQARARLREGAFGEAEAAGRALPYERALDEIRDWLAAESTGVNA
jgi:predicted ATPase/class 3 adenylate cyclase